VCYCVRMFVCACWCMCRYDVVSSGFADWTSTLLSKRDWRKRVSGGKRRSPPHFARCHPHFPLALHPSIHPSIHPSLLFSFSFSFSSNFSLSFFSFLSLSFLSSPSTSSSMSAHSQTTGAHAHTSGGKTRSRGKGVGLEAPAPRIKNYEITRKTGQDSITCADECLRAW
jgi:hypothetical protein